MFDVLCLCKARRQDETWQVVKQTKMSPGPRQAEIEGCIAPFMVYFLSWWKTKKRTCILINELSTIVNDNYTETRGGTADASKHGNPQMHETRDTISPVAGHRAYNVSDIQKANH